jgi:hypothetical protein
MTKNLTKKVSEEMILKKGIVLERRDYDFSSKEAQERIQKVLEKQKAIRKSIYYTKADLEKIYITI